MLKIRLQRVGRVHEPSFRLVLTDSKNSTKSGRFKEVLGSYDPRKSTDSLDAERIKYWLSQGASATDTVHNLLVRHRIINAKKIDVSAKSKKTSSSVDLPAARLSGSDGQGEAGATEGKPVVKEEVVETPEAPIDVIVEEAPTLAEGEVGKEKIV
ncbi:MAG: 30S ribosomal protein S16 [bacterium]